MLALVETEEGEEHEEVCGVDSDGGFGSRFRRGMRRRAERGSAKRVFAEPDNEQPETAVVYRGGEESSGDTAEETVSNTDDSGSGGQSEVGSGGSQAPQSASQIPADFPLPVPDAYQVEGAHESADDIEVLVSAPFGEEAYDFYLAAAPESGFEITESEESGSGDTFDGDIDCQSNDLEGSVDIDGIRVDINRRDFDD